MEKDHLLSLATAMTTAYIAQNRLTPEEVPTLFGALVRECDEAWTQLASPRASVVLPFVQPAPPPAPEAAAPPPAETVAVRYARATRAPAVPVDESVFSSHLICLEDGVAVKYLKSYLQRRHGMSPLQYRIRWGLPEAYPMTAPAISKARSQIAKRTGLGKTMWQRPETGRHDAI